jgi:hypothetical protein
MTNFAAWCQQQDPLNIPFRPGTPHTQGWGLRISEVGSPAHLADDRGSTPPWLVMPWDEGTAEWTPLPHWRAWGSFLRIVPDGAPFGVELHVAHTVPTEVYASSWSGRYRQGQRLPCRAAHIGVGTGAHTHTELVVEYSEERRDELRKAAGTNLVLRGTVNEEAVARHTEKWGLNGTRIMERLRRQIETWGIEEMSDRHAVRSGDAETFPAYRVPLWGRGRVLLVDPYWALRI